MTNPKIIRSIVFETRVLLTLQFLALPIILFFALLGLGLSDSPPPESSWLKFLIFVPPLILIVLGYVYASKLNAVYKGKMTVSPRREEVLIWLTILFAVLPAVVWFSSAAVGDKLEQIQGREQIIQHVAWEKANCQRGAPMGGVGNAGLYIYTCTGGMLTDGPFDLDQEIPK